MKAFLVVKVQPISNARLGCGDRRIGVQVDVLIFQASPKPLDEDVVPAPALAVHADLDGVGFQHAGEVGAGELTALIGVENLRLTESPQRLFQGLDTEVGMQRVRTPPGQNRSRMPIHDRHQGDEAFGQRNVGADSSLEGNTGATL
jgi:hypothetical protein